MPPNKSLPCGGGANDPATRMPSSDPHPIHVWFEAGIAVFYGDTRAERYPALNDGEAQRWWLGGFSAARAECPDDDPPAAGLPLTVALAQAPAGRDGLPRQLRYHASGWTNRTPH